MPTLPWYAWAGAGVLVIGIGVMLWLEMPGMLFRARRDAWIERAKKVLPPAWFPRFPDLPEAMRPTTPAEVMMGAIGVLAVQGVSPKSMSDEECRVALRTMCDSLATDKLGTAKPKEPYLAAVRLASNVLETPDAYDSVQRDAAGILLQTPVAELGNPGRTADQKFAQAMERAIAAQPIDRWIAEIPSVLGADGNAAHRELDNLLRLRLAASECAARYGMWDRNVFRAMTGIRYDAFDADAVNVDAVRRVAKPASNDAVVTLIATIDGFAGRGLEGSVEGSPPQSYFETMRAVVWNWIVKNDLGPLAAMRLAFTFGFTPETLGVGDQPDFRREFQNAFRTWKVIYHRFRPFRTENHMGLTMSPGADGLSALSFRYEAHGRSFTHDARQVHENAFLLRDAYPTASHEAKPSGDAWYLLYCGKDVERPVVTWRLPRDAAIELAAVSVAAEEVDSGQMLRVSFGEADDRLARLHVDGDGSVKLAEARGHVTGPEAA
jgi:hypothetical protein